MLFNDQQFHLLCRRIWHQVVVTFLLHLQQNKIILLHLQQNKIRGREEKLLCGEVVTPFKIMKMLQAANHLHLLLPPLVNLFHLH